MPPEKHREKEFLEYIRILKEHIQILNAENGKIHRHPVLNSYCSAAVCRISDGIDCLEDGLKECRAILSEIRGE